MATFMHRQNASRVHEHRHRQCDHTENLMIRLAQGVTVLENAAREAEVVDLAHCLIAMGAKIEGVFGHHANYNGCG